MEPLRFRQIRKELVSLIREELDEEREMLVDMSGRNLVCLIPGGEESFDRMARLHRELQDRLPISLSLGYAAKEWSNPRDLHNLYEEAEEKAEEKFLTGYGKIHRDSSPAPSDPILPARYLDSLFAALLQADREQCLDKFESLVSFLRKGTFRNYRQFINLLTYRFLVLQKESRNSPIIPRLIQIRKNPQILETLEIFTDFFRDIIMEILKEKSRGSQKSLSYFRLIEENLNRHFSDPTFCVQILAENTGLSPNYLRKIYREHSPLSLSDRIIQLRLEEACRLLRETDEPVKDIYEKAGFINYNSFFTSFKKGTGLTPALYRRNNQSA